MIKEQFTKDQAIAIANSGIHKDMTDEQIVKFQLFQGKLCMPFSAFHKAMEGVLGRPVFTHEFAYSDNLKKEYLGERDAPTFEEIMNLIPEDKRLIIKNLNNG